MKFINRTPDSITFNTAKARKALLRVPATAGKVTTQAFEVTGRVWSGIPSIVSGTASVIRKVAKG